MDKNSKFRSNGTPVNAQRRKGPQGTRRVVRSEWQVVGITACPDRGSDIIRYEVTVTYSDGVKVLKRIERPRMPSVKEKLKRVFSKRFYP